MGMTLKAKVKKVHVSTSSFQSPYRVCVSTQCYYGEKLAGIPERFYFCCLSMWKWEQSISQGVLSQEDTFFLVICQSSQDPKNSPKVRVVMLV